MAQEIISNPQNYQTLLAIETLLLIALDCLKHTLLLCGSGDIQPC